MAAHHRPSQPEARRAGDQPDRPTGSVSGRIDDCPTVALIAAEALSLVVGAYSPERAAELLGGLSGHDPAALTAAARACHQVTELDPAVRRAAAHLLWRAADRVPTPGGRPGGLG